MNVTRVTAKPMEQTDGVSGGIYMSMPSPISYKSINTSCELSWKLTAQQEEVFVAETQRVDPYRHIQYKGHLSLDDGQIRLFPVLLHQSQGRCTAAKC
jgi:hypothetical protein